MNPRKFPRNISSEYTEGLLPRKFPRNISWEYSEGLLPRNIPRGSFLGIFRGLRSSEIPDENSEEHLVGTSEDWTIGKSIVISRGKRATSHVNFGGEVQTILFIKTTPRAVQAKENPLKFSGKQKKRLLWLQEIAGNIIVTSNSAAELRKEMLNVGERKRFQLMLGTASPWLGQSLFVFDFVFLVVGLPSIVSARFGFQDLVFGVLTSMLSFIARGRLHSFLISLRLPFPLYSCISLQLSSHLWWLSLSPCLPLEIWIMFSFVYAMWAWKVISGLKCAELVSWSFGPFYPELCGFSVGCRLNSEETNFRGNYEDHQFVGKLLGIYRGRTSSGYFDGLSDVPILGSSDEMFLGIFIGNFRGTEPSENSEE
ncbi:hypothetical protein F2Q69_00037510 [Brassica cretica]|uniref:Uncharacterized protein n=1 Tax=Brassica cretica TaxID=69181 RepID=A0A8S9SK28_BRACR|nr:hypothetical protein F2Q69_00037510 [Brassica cretica]